MSGTHASSPTRHYGPSDVLATMAEVTNRGTGFYHCVAIATPLADATFVVAAPCGGKLLRAEIMSVDATTAAEIKDILIQNASNSNAEMVPQKVYDDNPALVALTPTALTLSTTAANLLVDQGDLIKVTWDITSAGTISAGYLAFWFEEF